MHRSYICCTPKFSQVSMFFQESLRFIQLLHHIFGCGLGKSIYIKWRKAQHISDVFLRCISDVFEMSLPSLNHWRSLFTHKNWDKKLLWQKMRSSHRKDLLQQSQNHQNRCILGDWVYVFWWCAKQVSNSSPQKNSIGRKAILDIRVWSS